MPAWFYILRLKSGHLYSGATTDLAQRWQDHQASRGGRTTFLDPPLSVVYQEPFVTFSAARQRESQIKRWSIAKKEALVSGNKTLLRRLAQSREP